MEYLYEIILTNVNSFTNSHVIIQVLDFRLVFEKKFLKRNFLENINDDAEITNLRGITYIIDLICDH